MHFLYLFAFSVFVAIVMGVFHSGDAKSSVKHGLKTFAEFMLISLGMAWIFYFIR